MFEIAFDKLYVVSSNRLKKIPLKKPVHPAKYWGKTKLMKKRKGFSTSLANGYKRSFKEKGCLKTLRN